MVDNLFTDKNDDEKKFNFERYGVYQRSVKFANDTYNLTKGFPDSEQFGLCSQLRRASMSIPLNLAEGFSNHYLKDKIRHYRIARCSVNECVPALKLSNMQEYIKKDDFKNLYNECYELSCMISGLIKSVE